MILAANVIEPAKSSWASPIDIASKKYETLFCVNYQKLNKVTIEYSYHIQSMEDCIDSLGDSTVKSPLDANKGYCKMPIAEEYREKKKFVTHCEAFRWICMLFGLRNSLATLQIGLDLILSHVRFKKCLVYVEDV